MNISGIRPSVGFYSYNSIKTSEMRSQQILANQEEQKKENSSTDEEYHREGQTFTSYDYAQNYRPEERFSLKGAESSLEQLDIDKVKMDLKKDQILQQYQYFVRGNGEQPFKERMSENFIL